MYNDSSMCFFCQNAPLPHISERTKQRKMGPIIELVKQLAGAEQKSDVFILCQLGKRICNLSGKRNLAQIFEKLGEENDNCISDFKNTVPVKAAILIKVKCMLSKTDYDNLRESLEDYLNLPCYKTIASHQRLMMPTEEDPEDFKIEGKPVGKFWSPLKVFQNLIEDILQTFHGQSQEERDRVPDEIWIKGGFVGDGFSGCTERIG